MHLFVKVFAATLAFICFAAIALAACVDIVIRGKRALRDIDFEI